MKGNDTSLWVKIDEQPEAVTYIMALKHNCYMRVDVYNQLTNSISATSLISIDQTAGNELFEKLINEKL